MVVSNLVVSNCVTVRLLGQRLPLGASIHPSPSTLSLLALSSLFVTCMNEPQAQLSRRSSDSLQIADGARASRCPVEHFEFGWPLPARTFCACRGDRAERTANWVGTNVSSFLLRKSGSGRDQGAREERAPPARYQLSALPCGASLAALSCSPPRSVSLRSAPRRSVRPPTRPAPDPPAQAPQPS